MEFEKGIKAILRQLDVKSSYQGYNYVVYGIELVLKDQGRLKYVTKLLYPDIAVKYHTSWKCVERNIRTVVRAVWKTDNPELLTTICGGAKLERPNNCQFFQIMSQYVMKLYGQKPPATAEGGHMFEDFEACFCPESGKLCQKLLQMRLQMENHRLEAENKENHT